MTTTCKADFIYPMLADVYYPIITQGVYGEVNKAWSLDRTIACNASGVGGAGKEDIKPDVFLQYDNKLIARSKTDLRIMSDLAKQAATNILITNVRIAATGELVYKETAGPRAGQGTIFEIGTIEPYVGPFNDIEYFKMLWRRTESQVIGSQVNES